MTNDQKSGLFDGFRDYLLTAVPPLVWGSTYLVTTSFLPADRPLTIALLRALPAGLLLLFFVRRLPTGEWWWRSAILGGLNIALFLSMLFVAAYRLPGGVAATVLSSQPLIVVFMARYWLREPVGRTGILGVLVGLLGVALLVLTPEARLDMLGLGAGLLGALAMATGTVLTRRWGTAIPPLTLTAWQLTAGGLWLVAPALFFETAPFSLTVSGLGAIAYLTLIGAAVTYPLWFRGLAMLGARRAAALGLLSPACAAVLGWVLLGQGLSPLQVAGLAATLGGIWLSQRQPDRAD